MRSSVGSEKSLLSLEWAGKSHQVPLIVAGFWCLLLSVFDFLLLRSLTNITVALCEREIFWIGRAWETFSFSMWENCMKTTRIELFKDISNISWWMLPFEFQDFFRIAKTCLIFIMDKMTSLYTGNMLIICWDSVKKRVKISNYAKIADMLNRNCDARFWNYQGSSESMGCCPEILQEYKKTSKSMFTIICIY